MIFTPDLNNHIHNYEDFLFHKIIKFNQSYNWLETQKDSVGLSILVIHIKLIKLIMEQHYMIPRVLTIITFLFAFLKIVYIKVQYTSKERTKSVHYLRILYSIDAIPLQMVDLFITPAFSLGRSFNNEIFILNQYHQIMAWLLIK